MANKTVYPYGSGGQLPSNIGIVNDLTTGGADKALSAEQGKILAQYAFLGSGTFADAYDKAKTTIAYFPWLLEDTDKDGNAIKKMIWHVGNKQFIDAIGAKIDGKKNGITINSDQSGYMRIWDGATYTSNYTDYAISNGETNFSFDEVGGNRHFFVEFVNENKDAMLTTATLSIDFGGMTITFNEYHDGRTNHGGINTYALPFYGLSGLKSITGLNIEATVSNNGLINVCSGCSALEHIQLGGNISGGKISGWFQQARSLIECDFSQLETHLTNLSSGFNFSLSNNLERVDIRGFDFSDTTNISSFMQCNTVNSLNTVVVGNIDTSNVTSSTGFLGNVTGATLVCTQDTPPGWGVDIIAGHFTSIKVPNKTVDVEGTATAVIDLYKAANGWSTYADIMSTYEEGKY